MHSQRKKSKKIKVVCFDKNLAPGKKNPKMINVALYLFGTLLLYSTFFLINFVKVGRDWETLKILLISYLISTAKKQDSFSRLCPPYRFVPTNIFVIPVPLPIVRYLGRWTFCGSRCWLQFFLLLVFRCYPKTQYHHLDKNCIL